METYSLFQLNEYIKRVIALNFQDNVWISAEISQVKLSRGNYYLELIQKKENSKEIIAQTSAILWYKKSIFLKRKFKDIFDSILDTGNEIRVKISVEFSERYGLSLYIEDLDASYTLGKAELQKQEIITKLQNEGLIERNAQHLLPIVLQKIAIISSSTAAGYKDFMAHLEDNSYQYEFHTQLFESSVQGKTTEKEIVNAIVNIENTSKDFDCIVIIRGGGAKLDLAAFDNYEIARKIALCSYPVLSGIGHEIDQSITDIVSHTDLKTPTAVADFIISRNLDFESSILDLGLRIQMASSYIFKEQSQYINLLEEQIKSASNVLITNQNHKLMESHNAIRHVSQSIMKQNKNLILSFEKQIELLAPQNVIKRGYSILRQNGKFVKSVAEIDRNQPIENELFDGKIKSKILE